MRTVSPPKIGAKTGNKAAWEHKPTQTRGVDLVRPRSKVNGSRTGQPNWGDYSSMSIDPAFDCTFWYTNEYLEENGGFWHTGISSFRFARCIPCIGDCDQDGEVTVNELSIINDIALGNRPITDCLAGDGNGDGEVTVDELIQASNNLFDGCPTSNEALPSGTAQTIGRRDGVTGNIVAASPADHRTMTVEIDISGGTGVLAAAQVDLIYDPDVFSDPLCAVAEGLPRNSLAFSFPVSRRSPQDSKARLRVIMAQPRTADGLPNGKLFSCSFHIRSDATPDVYQIMGDNAYVSDRIGDRVDWSLGNGQIQLW